MNPKQKSRNINLKILGKVAQKESYRIAKSQQQVAKTIKYPDAPYAIHSSPIKLESDKLTTDEIISHEDVGEDLESQSALSIRLQKVEAQLEELECMSNGNERLQDISYKLASYQDIDEMVLKYNEIVQKKTESLFEYPKPDTPDILACEFYDMDPTLSFIDIFEIQNSINDQKIGTGGNLQRSSNLSSAVSRNCYTSSDDANYSANAKKKKLSTNSKSLENTDDSAFAIDQDFSKSTYSIRSSSEKSNASSPAIKLKSKSRPASSHRDAEGNLILDNNENYSLMAQTTLKKEEASLSDEDDDEDFLPRRSAFKASKFMELSIVDEIDEGAFRNSPIIRPANTNQLSVDANLVSAAQFDELDAVIADEDTDDSISDSSYHSVSDEDDPVNLIPPQTFSNLYRTTLSPVREPKLEDKYEPSTSILKIRENNLSRRETNVTSKTIIPVNEALTFYNTIHDHEFREYFFQGEEIEEYPLYGGLMIIEIEKINQKIEEHSKKIEEGCLSAFISRSKLYMLKKQFDLALNDINSCLMLDSEAQHDANIYWQRHQCHLLEGNLYLSLRDLDKVTDKQRDHIGGIITKARIYQELGLFDSAITIFSTLCILKKRHPEPFLRRGQLYEMLGEFEKANEDFKKVVKLDPRNVYARYRSGLHYLERKFYTDALKEFQKLLEIDGTNGLFFALKGRTYACLSRWEKATKNVNVALKLIPNDYRVHYYRGCLMSETDPSSAIKDFSNSLLIEDGLDNSDSYYQRGLLYHKLGQFECAVDDYLFALSMRPKYHSAFLNLGTIYMIHYKDYELALEYYEKTILCDPKNITAYLYRGDVFSFMYKSRENLNDESLRNLAIRDYSQAMHLAPWSHLPYVHRGRLLLEKGLIKESKNDITAAVLLNPDESFLNKCAMLEIKKDYNEIISEYNKLRGQLDYKPDPVNLIEAGKAYMNIGSYESALGIFNRAMPLIPQQQQSILLEIGICYSKMKLWNKAIATFTSCILAQHGFAERGITDILKAIKFAPLYFAAQYFCAGYFYEQKNYLKCVDFCNAALASESMSVKTVLLRGSSRTKIGQYSLALADFCQAVRMNRSNSSVFYQRAICHEQMGNFDKAIIDYSITLFLEQNSNAYRNRGLLYWQKRDSTNALIDLQAAVEYSYNDASLHVLLAICLQRVHLHDESIKEFNIAIAINPFMIEAFIGRGNVYVIQGKLKKARKDYGRVIHLFPRNQEAFVNISYTYQMEGKSRKSWDIFNELLALSPNSTMGLEGRAIVNYYMKNYFNALTDITRAIELEPENAEFLTNKGLIYKAMDDYSAAYNCFVRATKVDSKYSLAFYNIGNMYFRNARMTDAILSYSKALEINDIDKYSLLNRGITRTLTGDKSGAMNDFERCILLDANFAQAYTNRGHLKHMLGDFVAAENDFTKSLNIQPGDSLTLYKRAKSLGAQGKLKEALEDVDTSFIYDSAKLKDFF